MYECFHCGAKAVFWNADFDYQDYGMEGEGIVHVCTCSNCGAHIEYYIDLEENEKDVKPASFEEREWIDPHNDRRPMTDDWVLVTANESGNRYVTLGKFDETWWYFDDDTEVVAWMPLPEPVPKKDYVWGEEWTRQ